MLKNSKSKRKNVEVIRKLKILYVKIGGIKQKVKKTKIIPKKKFYNIKFAQIFNLLLWIRIKTIYLYYTQNMLENIIENIIGIFLKKNREKRNAFE